MNSSAAGDGLPAVQFSGTATVLVEITADIHICGLCKTQFNNLDTFVAHKQSGCQLGNASTGATSTVQFVSGETVTPSPTVARTITSETQTITVSAPEFVFEHGYQTFLPSDTPVMPPSGGVVITTKSRSKKLSAAALQKKLNCIYPGCPFKTAYGMKDMERHMRIHTGDKPHRCDTCGKCFSRKDKLKTHIRSHTGEKPYKCKECDYCAADSSSLCKHTRIHTDERPFKCQICPYASRNSSQLTVHLRSHTGDAPFQCMLCSSKFKINSDLRRHMRVHTGEKPYRCDFCDFYCAMKGNLKSHIRMKHNSECRFKCTQCDFQCSSKGDLRRHLRSHLPELPVKCKECNYSCANRAALKVHERIHSQDRPFKCHLCQFDTKQRSNLTTHIKKVHGDDASLNIDPQKPEAKLTKQYSSQKGNKVEAKKTFKCDLCEASFVRIDSLRSHKRQHNEIMLQKAQQISMLQLSADQSRPGDIDNFDKDDHDGEDRSRSSLIKEESIEERNGQESGSSNQLHMLSHVNLMASPQSLGSQVIVCETVVPASPEPESEDSIQEVLIENGGESDLESSENPTFISESGMSCSDLDNLNALIQEETTVVIVDSEAGDNPGPSPPIYATTSQAGSPKQRYTIEESDSSSVLLCPADSIPD